jgi:hypothetical protein
MRRGLVALGFVAAVAAAGSAFADVRDVLTANTLILTDNSDNQTAYLLDADGRFTETAHDGKQSHGVWTLKDGRLCVTPEGQSAACVPMGDDRVVGQAWDIKGPTGQVVWRAGIVAGREKTARPAQ